MIEDGKITAFGTYDELTQKEGTVKTFLENSKNNDDKSKIITEKP